MPRRRRTSARDPREPKGHRPSAFLWSVGALILCAAFLGASLGGIFKVRRVEIVGATAPSDAAQVAGVMGQNIFTVRSDQVVRRLSVVHAIDVRRVETAFPDRVTIFVHQRQPFLAWQNGGTLFEVDPDGRIISQVQHSDLPVITGTPPGHELTAGVVQATRYAAENLPQAPNGAVAVFQVNENTGLVIRGRAGWMADVGRGTTQLLVDRIAELAAILRDPKVRSHQLSYVDLRSAEPILRFSGA